MVEGEGKSKGGEDFSTHKSFRCFFLGPQPQGRGRGDERGKEPKKRKRKKKRFIVKIFDSNIVRFPRDIPYSS